MYAPVSTAELEAELARRSLRDFIDAAWPVVEPGNRFISNWHIDAIAEHLEAVSRREIRRLIINVPPRHMKSLAASVFWPCWEWLSRPYTEFLCASYAQQLSNRDSLKCRRLLESTAIHTTRTTDGPQRTLLERIGYRGLLALLQPDPWRLCGDQNAKRRFENTASGYRLATSVGGTATGEGGDIIVIDDAHKADETESDAVRESVLDWYDATMSTRLNDPKRGAVVVIMQRLHERDLTGHLLEHGGWEHLCLPAQYEPNHPHAWPHDPRTDEGHLLWGQRVGESELATLKRALGSYRAAGQLQQRPAPAEGAILKRAWWRWYDPDGPLPDFEALIQSWDMAFKDTDGSDYVVGQVWGRYGAEKYLLGQTREKLEFTETLDAVRNLTAWVKVRFSAHPAHAKLVEDKANGPAVISTLRREIPGLIAVDPQGDKVARARAIAPDVEAGNVYLPGHPNHDATSWDPATTPAWVQQLVDECATFPNSAHDDQVDALSQALLRLAGAGHTYKQQSTGTTLTGGLLDQPL